jgi:hypothetical protein
MVSKLGKGNDEALKGAVSSLKLQSYHRNIRFIGLNVLLLV